MEQKRVSFEIAKTLKDVGYPQGSSKYLYDENGALESRYEYEQWHIDTSTKIDVPTYLDVWLWLWREKKNCIDIFSAHNHDALVHINGELKGFPDPEEAIISVINYLAENNLIK